MDRTRWGHFDVTVTPVQPYAARKDYVCPGCESIIPAGTFHLVVVPDEAADLRRHWHRGCWFRELKGRRHLPDADTP